MNKWLFFFLFLTFTVQSQYNKEWTKANVVDMNSLEIKALKSWIDKNLLTNPKVTIIQSQNYCSLQKKVKTRPK